MRRISALFLLLGVVIGPGALAGVPQEPLPQPGIDSCPCSELDRRHAGFNYALSFAPASSAETCDLRRALDVAGSELYRGLSRLSWQDRLETCRRANRRVEAIWNRWYEWLAFNGGEVPPHCLLDDPTLHRP